MTALLTDNLPLLAGSPNGIQKLRELILELAVRGKLAPQDSSDEPASELLKRIAEEKARLVAEGKIRKQMPLAAIGEDERPFELPEGWEWVRLSDLVNVLNGRAYKKEELLDSGTPVLRVGNLFTSNHWYYSDLVLEEDKYCNPGDLLFAWSASFGPFIWSGERVIYHYHIWKLDFYAERWLSKHYLYNFLLGQTQEIKAAGHGVSMVHMTKEKMEKLIVPVPPLAEQHRIVAKVDELMALCDRLEARQADAEIAHARLVQALLDSLTQASDADDFAASWQRLAAHFDSLFTSESSIDALKQTLLQLAVMGKLVPQDPSDEPASELLKRIAEQKARLVAEGKIKKQKLSAEVASEELPFELPVRWSWARFGDLCVLITSGSRGWNEYYSEAGSTFIRSQDIKTDKLNFDNRAFVTLPESAEGVRTRVECGDILITITGANVAKAALIEDHLDDAYVSQHVALIRLAETSLGIFVHRWLVNSHGGRRLLLSSSYGAKPGLNLNNIRDLLVPIPPLPEQHRIVAKLDQLLSFCDQLKSRLTAARQLHERLAGALVEQAVA